MCCCCGQLPAWSLAAGASCRVGLLLPVPVAGLVPVLPVPVPVASLMCGSRCQLPAWSVAAGASGRLGLLLPEPVAGAIC
ncbi:hypothetical protein PR002_g25097 [Phytophthora rubi]|uniref:Secreted protein n=1 Tax=Phytophthora rubi TaxID=129364 RepID=A0A6A3I9W7_9STRA|nr:hypothetical protein PR002_g25097 [Phytophthora rubi]